jgi:putative addiction module component (TIGR02574 family)
MTEEAARLLAEALHLSEEDRGELADRLLDSIEPVLDPSWDEEIRRRIEEVDSGKEKPIPWAEARRRIMEDDGDAAPAP